LQNNQKAVRAWLESLKTVLEAEAKYSLKRKRPLTVYSVKAAKTNAPIKTATAAAISASKTLAIRANAGSGLSFVLPPTEAALFWRL
jgi:hypothetical protein